MSRRQVTNERAVTELAWALKRLDDANPDVGMGPSLSLLMDQALTQLGLTDVDIDCGEVHVALLRRSRK